MVIVFTLCVMGGKVVNWRIKHVTSLSRRPHRLYGFPRVGNVAEFSVQQRRSKLVELDRRIVVCK